MQKIQGPAIFLAQFMRDEAPFNDIKTISKWAADLGYKGIQIPTWDPRAIDLDKAAESKTYCEEYLGMLAGAGVEAVDLGSYLQGQCLAFHPAYAEGFSVFHPEGLKGSGVTEWAGDQLRKSVHAAVNLGISNISVMSGGFLWHMIYPWPQRPDGFVEEAFTELAARWRPVLELARDKGITFGYELHPGSDLYDGATYEMFLEKVDNHPAACLTYDPSHFLLQQLDYLEFIRRYGDRIRAVHVKDAEFNPDGRVGVYGGYQSWVGRAGRFRSLGDGQVDFKRMFTLLIEAGYEGWAILEWECCIKSSGQGAREGAPFIAKLLIDQTDVAFDDFAGGETDRNKNRKMLGLD
jgi:sugar phosphate isomerase/epimerase